MKFWKKIKINKGKCLSWLFLITWLIVIFVFSNQSGEDSSNLSNGLISFIKEVLSFNITDEAFSFIVRKMAHFTEYFILGLLSINVLKEYHINKKTVLLCFILCILYASSDEFHQLFINARSPRIFDVFIDSLGSIFGITIYLIVKKKINSR